MPILPTRVQRILGDPGSFALTVLRSFRENQGLLLAGAIAYYTLLSIVPLFTLLLVALSHIVDEGDLLATLAQYLDLIVPGQAGAVVDQITRFLEHREVVGWLLILILLFFSSVAFSVLENAMSVIFVHRMRARRRHFLVSAIIPFVYILCLGFGFLVTTLIATGLTTISGAHLALFGVLLPLDSVSRGLAYLIGLGGEVLILTSIYMVMPVGRLSWRKALVGGITAGILWEISRNALVWYFSTLSVVHVVYGSLATVIFVLLALDVAALILLLGAQVIADYERLPPEPKSEPPSQRA